ncbi:MAG: DUF1295 domain-containing protein [Dokdonella sp.]|uniref:DUF1295 domain-containing protein n=1 Tax=Dokdonella sp. TaxID=2291710 RepID=UPI003F80B270
MNIAGSLLLVWLSASIAQACAWNWQRRHRNAGIVDVTWAAGVGGAAIVLAALGDGAGQPRTLLALLGGAWGLRLASHLWRRVRGEREDGRYAHLRALWDGDQRRWFALFQFQALLVALFAVPFIAVAANPEASLGGAVGAASTWAIAMAGEFVADAQLARFRADPANHGRTCRQGLWRYSRHPNYFFEWLHWFTYVLLAIGSPVAWMAWAGPLVMYVFLRFISGVPYTEAQALRSRGEDYRRYQRATPMLIPWFPRSER